MIRQPDDPGPDSYDFWHDEPRDPDPMALIMLIAGAAIIVLASAVYAFASPREMNFTLMESAFGQTIEHRFHSELGCYTAAAMQSHENGLTAGCYEWRWKWM